ncbi:MAG: histidine phosphatase family protein [Clostridia bacterium]|nr:histidine phosphatase family protein [Clostridia bacterium]
MKTIILVRHGESETNTLKVFTGQLDASLTDMGREQARLMAEAIDVYKPDVVYTSPLERAVETAMAICNRHGCELIKNPSFCEIYAGKWQGITFDEIAAKYPDTYKTWKEDISKAKPEGGESCQALYDRVTKGFRAVLDDAADTVCIVAHATPIRMMESYMYGGSIERAKDIFWVNNASLSIYQYDGKEFHTVKRSFCDYLGDKKTNLPKSI